MRSLASTVGKYLHELRAAKLPSRLAQLTTGRSAAVFYLMVLCLIVFPGGPQWAWDRARASFATLSAYGVAIATGHPVSAILPESPIPGLLYVDAPQVYTRERLVNDRFRQATWLEAELRSTPNVSAAEWFAQASRGVQGNKRTSVEIKSSGAEEQSTQETGNASAALTSEGFNAGGDSPPPTAATLSLDPSDLFERLITYRAQVRDELMATLLDDAHDLEGNTLYRLNFDAVAMPWFDTGEYPGIAVFVVTVRRPTIVREQRNGAGGVEQINPYPEDDLELLRDWEREMQSLLTRVLEYRKEAFDNQGTLSNPTDPKELIAFDWFLRATLIDSLVGLLSDNVILRIPCEDGHEACSTEEQAAKLVWAAEAARKQKLGEWLGLMQRNGHLAPDSVNEEFGAALQEAIFWAQRVNKARWAAALKPECAAQYSPVVPLASMVPSECPTPLFDVNNHRALIRLIAVVEELRRRLGSRDTDSKSRFKKLFSIQFDKNGQRGRPSGLDEILDALQEAFPTADDIDELQSKRQTDAFPTNVASGTLCQSNADLGELGRCLFINTPTAQLGDELIARFITKRLKYELPGYGPGTSIVEFLDLNVTGCKITFCRIEVRRISNEKGAGQLSDTGRYINRCGGELEEAGKSKTYGPDSNADLAERMSACRLRHWLEERRNDLSVYSVSPRAQAEVTLAEQRDASDLSARLQGMMGTIKGGPAITLRRAADIVQHDKSAEPFVIGFSQVAQSKEGDRAARDAAIFGWVVRPRVSAITGYTASHHRISAVLSVPSWWKRLDVDVRACWVSRARSLRFDNSAIDEPASLCAATQGARDVPAMVREFSIELPRRVEDVTARFKLDVIKAPYFDFDWIKTDGQNLELEVGRPGRLVLAGERLWRGTVVTVGEQMADEISVLPDMKGVVAKFNCVQPPPATSPSERGRGRAVGASQAHARDHQVQQGERPLPGPRSGNSNIARDLTVIVWTAEGRTRSQRVAMKAFGERVPGERPCFFYATP